jgi:DNA-binding CsgD family transcriptional regulator
MLRGDEENCFGFSNGGGDSSQSPDRRGKQGPVGRNRAENTMTGTGIGSAATKLTDKILGSNTDDLADIMKDIAAEFGLSHIAYLCLATDKSPDQSLLTAVTTFPKEWQARYFMKQYIKVDPTIARGRTAVLPFDWDTLERHNPTIINFFKDANRHNVGRNGISIPVRNRRNVNSIVSFTSDAQRPAWEMFKKQNMAALQRLAALIDSATLVDYKLPEPQVRLSRREEECLIWTARGKTHQEIGDILGLSPTSVRTHLDTVRHKLRCINLTHAVGVAVASGAIPALALRDSP